MANSNLFPEYKDGLTFKGQCNYQLVVRKAIPKNAQTTAQLHSSHTLVK